MDQRLLEHAVELSEPYGTEVMARFVAAVEDAARHGHFATQAEISSWLYISSKIAGYAAQVARAQGVDTETIAAILREAARAGGAMYHTLPTGGDGDASS